MDKQKQLIKKIEGLLRSRRKFQEYALDTYVRNYYVSKNIQFDTIKLPPKVAKDVDLKTLLNFDAFYCDISDMPTICPYLTKKWKINFLLANNCVIKVLKDILKELNTSELAIPPTPK